MRLPEIPKPLLIILGPTASGKTGVSLALAHELGGEIVSADSRLFYRGMDIGTAKPALAEMDQIPHHLINVSTPDETWSLPLFQQAANKAIAAIHARARLPIMVGGTGQYIRAVIEGWDAPPSQPDHKLRDFLTKLGHEMGSANLHKKLELLDPLAASKIERKNLRRTVRALEVIYITGKRFSDQQGKKPCPYSLLMVGILWTRTELYQRIDERIDAMFQNGLLAETGTLLRNGYDVHLPAFSAIGYREAAACLRGEMTEAEARTAMRHLTRQFVRRQTNWFKPNDPKIHWVQSGSGCLELIKNLVVNASNWLPPG
jgi:tRNA dimethylallyltransferase